MAQIQTILVPVDFSSHSEIAVDYAVTIAKQFGAKLHLLHCYQINLGSISPYGPVMPENLGDEIRKAAEQKLGEWRAKLVQQGMQTEQHLSPLFPPEGIAESAAEVGADLIVMGTRGLTGFKHVLLGSVAERTVRTAPCPVLTVKAD